MRGIPPFGLPLALLALALAACVPTVAIDRTVAYDGTPVRVEPGATVRVVVPELAFQPRKNVTGSFVLRAAAAPEGWTVALDRVERIVTRIEAEDEGPAGASRDASHAGRTYSLVAYLRVHVPADADPGAYSVAATIRARNTVESTARVTFAVPR